MAMSRAFRPLLPARQASSVPEANTTCSTGQSASSKGVSLRAAAGCESAKAVAFRTTAGEVRAQRSRSSSAATGSLRLVT